MTVFLCTGNKGKLEEFKQAFQDNEKIIGLNDFNLRYAEPQENSNCFICNAAIKLFSALQFLLFSMENNENLREINKIIVDDSGLCVPDLNYLPGVHSAHFAGHPKNDVKNNFLLQSKIEENINAKIYKNEKRLNAFFVCFLLSLSFSEQELKNLEFIKNANFSQAKNLQEINIVSLEKKYLEKINIKNSGGAYHEKFQASLLYEKFPADLFINLNYGYCCGEVSNKEQNNILGAGHGYDPLFYSNLNPELSFASIPLAEKNKISHRAFAMDGLKKVILQE